MNRRQFIKNFGLATIVAAAPMPLKALAKAIKIEHKLVGDGVTDNTEALQYLLNQGGTVYIPEGTYAFKSVLTWDECVNIEGDHSRGKQTKLY